MHRPEIAWGRVIVPRRPRRVLGRDSHSRGNGLQLRDSEIEMGCRSEGAGQGPTFQKSVSMLGLGRRWRPDSRTKQEENKGLFEYID